MGLACTCFLWGSLCLHGGDAPPFGFAGIEIFKVGQRAAVLEISALNDDALADLAFIDNAKGSVAFLLGRAPGEAAESDATEINDVASDTRFRRADNLTEKRIHALAIADMNGDGKPDIAFHGEPEGLEIHWGGKKWDEDPKIFPVHDPLASLHSLKAGDIDGDGRPELLLLTKRGFQVFAQAQGIAADRLIPLEGKTLQQAFLKDFDGDGRIDLLYTAPGEHQVRLRRGQGDALGPEHAFRVASMSFLATGDVCDAPGEELVAVQQNPLRVSVFGLAKRKSAGALGQILAYALPGGAESEVKALAIGDIDGDAVPDLCVALADGADIGVFRGRAGGAFGALQRWPTLAEVEALLFATVDEKPALIVVSGQEKSLGIMRWDGQRLAFPRIIGLPEAPTCCVKVRDSQGREKFAVGMSGGSKDHVLVIGAIEKDALKEEARLTFGGRVKGALAGDFNGCGREELLVFPSFAAPEIVVWDEKGAPKKLDSTQSGTKSLLEKAEVLQVSAGALSEAPGAHLLFVQKNFIRVMRLDAEGKLTVADQYDAVGGAALAQAVVVDNDGDGRAEILAYDGASKKLFLFKKDADGLMKPVESLELPGLGAQRLAAADLNGDGRPEIVCARRGDVALLVRSDEEVALKSIISAEVKELRLAQLEVEQPRGRGQEGQNVSALTVGDLNGDGRNDIAFVTSKDFRLHILVQQGDALKEVMDFPIVEKKAEGFESAGAVRQLLIGDATGDKLADLMVLINDRLLLYPQDALQGDK